ncbi:YhcH/YjgK/YiaL family protein [Patescibacteria group bacterium]|nr:YhcH/YjgK/YiaL family protein [Patescibacteria group bacterium]
MIIDSLENSHIYHFGPAWKKAFDFLNSLTPQSEDKKYLTEGDDIFAIVMSYTTTAQEKSMLESHQNYVDIQTTLRGAEAFECFSTAKLKIKTPYDASKDAAFYTYTPHYSARVNVTPGAFVMLYPHDAHMAGLVIDNKPEFIKKVVVKIKKELLMQL